jgi:Dyp-type peroxidase family
MDLDDIQGLVIRGYHMPVAGYLFYRFDSGVAARSWLRAMIEPVTTAAEWEAKPSWCANVALTYGGLEALGLSPESLATFPEDFREGMAARAAVHLGESGPDLPANWPAEPPFATRGVHAMLLISANDRAVLDERLAVVTAVAAATAGVVAVGYQDAAALGPDGRGDREHFGYRDGISQPALKGSGLENAAHAEREAVEPGEFLLGHVDEMGNTAMPWPAALGHNGTYAVYRRLHQDVAAFRQFLHDSGEGEALAAKLMGRWPSGAPLVLSDQADDPLLAADRQRNNDFSYVGDPLGYLCPRGAHVRRARPRDGTPGVRRRLLIRRGLPYGQELPEAAPDDGADRGLVGLFLNASIERQFEFVQRKWLNGGQFDGLGNDPDPIAGPGAGDFTCQRRPLPRRYTGLPRIVTVRGGDYFFMPSITAMRFLSDPDLES